MKILMIGDIVGSPGRRAVTHIVSRWKLSRKVDFVVANGENAAAGRGLTEALSQDLIDVGVDVITLGDHTWDQKEMWRLLDKEERVIRPLNFSKESPGRGMITVSGPKESKVSVINIIGRVFMNPVDCPFHAIDRLLQQRQSLAKIIIVDFHAEATSEKNVMGRFLDGRVTLVAGTHTHVQTSDETILPKGSAFITDLGMTGPKDSIIGMDVENVTAAMISGIRRKFEVAKRKVYLEGVLIDVSEVTGRVKKIVRVREFIE